jgi:hypothetical protein
LSLVVDNLKLTVDNFVLHWRGLDSEGEDFDVGLGLQGQDEISMFLGGVRWVPLEAPRFLVLSALFADVSSFFRA